MTKPKVSVIVPVYNVQDYLDDCMVSIVGQTFTDLEIIMVDDGSTDSSGQLCEDWAKKDSRIRVVHKQNAGLGFARNTGIEHASGDYLAFIDSDDYVAPEMLETLYNYALSYGAEVVYSAGFYRAFSNGEIKDPVIDYDGPVFYHAEAVVSQLLPDVISAPPEHVDDGKVGVSTWKALYKAELFTEKGLRFPSEREFISEDAIYQIDCLKLATSALVIPEVLYYYRENFASLSMKYKLDRFELDKVLYHEQLRRVEGLPNQETLVERIQRIFISNIRLCIFQEALHKENSNKIRLERLREICRDTETKEVLAIYPIHRLPFPKRLICILAKHKMVRSLQLLTNLKYRNRSL